jgi:type VI secretion system protein ImpH
MATTRRGAADALGGPDGEDPGSPAGRLYSEAHAFDFFQAVRLLQWLEWGRPAVGRMGPPSAEPVRFRAHASLSFPPSALYDLSPPPEGRNVPVMTESFMGLTGPSGALPRHYTELLLRIEKEQRGPEKYALRDWLDLFNHRLVSHFYRAWEKYRFYLAYERGGPDRAEPDTFTQALLSLVGLGMPALRNRLKVTGPESVRGPAANRRTLARVEDLSLLYFGGLLAHRPRSAVGLRALLRGHFRLDVEVRQFQGQWLRLEPSSMTRLGEENGNNQLGFNALAGERVWDVQSKILVRVGPLDLERFQELLPEVSSRTGRNAFFLLTHLIRFYVGPEIDFDVQLVLRADEVPGTRLPYSDDDGPALGWNTWLRTEPFPSDADDAVFPGSVVFRIEDAAVA